MLLKSTASTWTARSHHDLLTPSSPVKLPTELVSQERRPLKWSYPRQPSSPTSPCRTSRHLCCDGGWGWGVWGVGVYLTSQEVLSEKHKELSSEGSWTKCSVGQSSRQPNWNKAPRARLPAAQGGWKMCLVVVFLLLQPPWDPARRRAVLWWWLLASFWMRRDVGAEQCPLLTPLGPQSAAFLLFLSPALSF